MNRKLMTVFAILAACAILGVCSILLIKNTGNNSQETAKESIPAEDTAPKTFYVSVDGNDDTGDGSINAPWKTIGKAALILKAGDTCIVREGTYRETVMLSNSGTENNPIKLQAYPDEKVTISGTELIDGWTNYSGQIYKTSLPWDLRDQNQFLINGDTLWEARWPNLSKYTMEGFRTSMAVVDSGTAGSITDSELTQPDGYWTGATLWCRGGGTYEGWGPWLSQTSIITGFDGASHKVNFTPFRESYFAADPTKYNEYYISGLLSLLDSPMEWYVDSKKGQIYLIAPDGQKPVGVEMKKRITAIDISNKSFIEIDGITLLASNINMQGANHCRLFNMDMKWINYSSKSSLGYESQIYNGICITGDYNEVKNCTIEYTTGTGILVSGSNNRVVNNYFHDINYSNSMGAPVLLAGYRNLISHNTMKEVSKCCISQGIQLCGTENLVQYNDLSRFMMLSADGAAIYCFAMDGGNTRIHHNKIHDWPTIIAHGIYMDGYEENFIVDHNVIYNGRTFSFGIESPHNDDMYAFNMASPENYNLIYNNTTYSTGYSIFTDTSGAYGGGWYGHEWYGSRVQNNIFTNTVVKPTAPGEYVYDNNIEKGTNPKYSDPSSDNFILQQGSPAIDNGVVIPGITDGYNGSAPDLGAYESGQEEWKAGCDFDNPPNSEFIPVDTPYMNRLHNSGFEYGYSYFSGDEYISGITDWMCTGEKNASLLSADQSRAGWFNRGIENKLILGGGIDGVEQVVSNLKSNTAYRLTGWTYVDSGESISFGVKDYGGSDKKVTNTNIQYKRDSILFTTGPQSTSATIFIQKDSTGPDHAYADDFGVVLAE